MPKEAARLVNGCKKQKPVEEAYTRNILSTVVVGAGWASTPT